MLVVSLLAFGTHSESRSLDTDFGRVDEPSSASLSESQGLGGGARRRMLKGGVLMTYVQEGVFTMGSDAGPKDERPQRKVYVDAFWIGINDVTVGQFRAYCSEQGIDFSTFPAPKWGWENNHPMVNVTWDQARAFCKWAGGDLPTEAQWEKAARGTDGRLYPWGNEWNPLYLWCSKTTPGDAGTTAPIGKYAFASSPYGCLDMEGNVFQWCLDWEGPYDPADLKNPKGPSSGVGHVLRGGAWTFFRPEFFHSSTRTLYNPPILSNHGFGFRVAAPPAIFN